MERKNSYILKDFLMGSIAAFVMTPMASISPKPTIAMLCNAMPLAFAFKDVIKRQIIRIPSSSSTASEAHKLGAHIAAGSLAGTLVFGLECAVYQTNQGKQKLYYKHVGTPLLAHIVFRGLYIGLYDYFKPWLPSLQPKSLVDEAAHSLLLGYGVALCASVVAEPIMRVHLYRVRSKKSIFNAVASLMIKRELYGKNCASRILLFSLSSGCLLPLYDYCHKAWANCCGEESY